MVDSLIVLILFFATIAECKYCWHTTTFGKSTHFYCGAFEYCCGDKCCENFSEFYKLWYFWLCIVVLMLSGCVLLYWLKRRFYSLHHNGSTQPRRHHRRHRRRYRQLTGESNSSAQSTDVLPGAAPVMAPCPPPYGGDNTGCPHPGPPPYALGSGSSINSATLPRFPPSYDQVTKNAPPPSYSSLVEVVTVSDLEGKKNCDIDNCCGGSSNTDSNNHFSSSSSNSGSSRSYSGSNSYNNNSSSNNNSSERNSINTSSSNNNSSSGDNSCTSPHSVSNASSCNRDPS